jgi:L-asparaginase
LIDLGRAIEEAFRGGSVGVVVTQGTDTLEECAFALDLLVDSDLPIVVTGAMQNPAQPGSDGPANLVAAVQVAISKEARGLGVLVVMNDEIHAARFVRKTHTTSRATFQSPTIGPVGWVNEGRVRIPFRISPLEKIHHGTAIHVPKVAIVTMSLGGDDAQLKQIEAMGYRAVVIEGFGGGHVPSALVPTIEDLATRIPVVLTSRTGSGEILISTYGFAGSEMDLLARGVISAGALDGLKARVLLTLVLSSTQDLAKVKSLVEKIINTD